MVKNVKECQLVVLFSQNKKYLDIQLDYRASFELKYVNIIKLPHTYRVNHVDDFRKVKEPADTGHLFRKFLI